MRHTATIICNTVHAPRVVRVLRRSIEMTIFLRTKPLHTAIDSEISSSRDDALHRKQAEHAQFMCIYLLRGIAKYIGHREHRRRDVNQLFILAHSHAAQGFVGIFFA
ncbi:hypothetical protein PEC301875_16280 [Pectobacterium carotovorum subsp. carotovorum]|nr:hypothetical protein PEC301875_16280 [Pectobacterium carotovorum subsp. carotovorum]